MQDAFGNTYTCQIQVEKSFLWEQPAERENSQRRMMAREKKKTNKQRNKDAKNK